MLKKVASKKKPVLLSTGASSISEINNAISVLNSSKCRNIVVMHCILSYPAKNEHANLGMISDLKKKFPQNIIGYSDHTLPDREMTNMYTSYVLGAKVLEKHFTLNKKAKGNDHYHSMDFKDLINLRKRILNAKKIIGSDQKKHLKIEYNSRKYARRSLVLKNDLDKNSRIKMNNIICKRPGIGISPIYLEKILGKKVKKKLKEDHILKWADLK